MFWDAPLHHMKQMGDTGPLFTPRRCWNDDPATIARRKNGIRSLLDLWPGVDENGTVFAQPTCRLNQGQPFDPLKITDIGSPVSTDQEVDPAGMLAKDEPTELRRLPDRRHATGDGIAGVIKIRRRIRRNAEHRDNS